MLFLWNILGEIQDLRSLLTSYICLGNDDWRIFMFSFLVYINDSVVFHYVYDLRYTNINSVISAWRISRPQFAPQDKTYLKMSSRNQWRGAYVTHSKLLFHSIPWREWNSQTVVFPPKQLYSKFSSCLCEGVRGCMTCVGDSTKQGALLAIDPD